MVNRWIISVLLLACLLLSPARPASAGEGDGIAAAFSKSFLLTPSTTLHTLNATVQVDSAGGVHTAFVGEQTSTGAQTVYYAYCPSGCTNPQKWKTFPVGDMGVWGDRLVLQVTASGDPRLMWYYQGSLSLVEDSEFRYAERDAQGVWHEVTVASGEFLAVPSEGSYFALTSSGKPRFIYTDTDTDVHEGTFYGSCEGSCADPKSWTESLLTAELNTVKENLAFTKADAPRIVLRQDHTVSFDTVYNLYYYECTANCTGSKPTWSAVKLYTISSEDEFSFRLTSGGQPRLALYRRGGDHRLYYAACASGCAAANNWNINPVGQPANMGRSPSLAIDSSDRPHLAFTADSASSESGLRYATCSANCAGASPTWAVQAVELPEQLDQISPIPAKPGYASMWLHTGQNPSLAVGPGNAPVIVYGNEHVQTKSTSTLTDIKALRIALSSSTVKPSYPNKVFLPALRRE